jgi:hypothetical protein
MALLTNRTRFSALAGALLCGVVAMSAVAKADGQAKGGNLRLTSGTLMFNPCNGQMVSGPIDVLLGVHVNGNGTNVNVFRQLHGTLTDALGNEYKVSSIAHQQFDEVFPNFYVLEFTNKVVGLGNGPSFDFEGRVRIDVDADQKPIGYAGMGTASYCR